MNPLTPLGMTTKEFITTLGGTKFVAGYCGVASPSVSNWIKTDAIPDGQMAVLAPLAEKRKIATRQQLCPLTFKKIWPELG